MNELGATATNHRCPECNKQLMYDGVENEIFCPDERCSFGRMKFDEFCSKYKDKLVDKELKRKWSHHEPKKCTYGVKGKSGEESVRKFGMCEKHNEPKINKKSCQQCYYEARKEKLGEGKGGRLPRSAPSAQLTFNKPMPIDVPIRVHLEIHIGVKVDK